MNINTSSNREEFEESARAELKKVIEKARKLRNNLRLLEDEVSKKKEKINNYQKVLQELQEQLVKIQAIIYANGTA